MFEEILKEIRAIYPDQKFIPLHAPVLGAEDKSAMMNVIDSGFVSSVGQEVSNFEDQLAAYTGAKKVVAVMNGTAALHLGLILSGVKSGDLVITQGLTFVATANAIAYVGAEPVFIDSEKETLGMSPEALESFLKENAEIKNGKALHKQTGRIISACVPMHVFGHPVKIEKILSICQNWGIAVIEDAAEALGSFTSDKHCGTLSPIGTLSFNGNKIITTGGGGALLFQDERLALRAKHLSTTAKVPHPWNFIHDEIGYNYRLPNLNAALGCSQLKRLDIFLEVKKRVADRYKEIFSGRAGFRIFEHRQNTSPNFWLNAVFVESKEMRNNFLKEANESGVGCRPVWELMTDLSIYKHCFQDDLTNARHIAAHLINLPSGVPV